MCPTRPVVPVDGSAEFHEPAATRLAAFGTPCPARGMLRLRSLAPPENDLLSPSPCGAAVLCSPHARAIPGRGCARLPPTDPRRCFASSSSLSSSSLLTQGRPGFIPCVNLYISHMHTTPNGRRTPSLFVPRDNSRQPCLANQEKRRPIFSPPFLRF